MKMSLAIIVGGGLFIFIAVVFVVVFIPGWVWNPPPTIVAHSYTSQEDRGRELYWSNGCDYCHTQYVRYYDTERTGPVSQGGNYTYDQPPVLGSERTGPDLSYIGRKRDMQWEIEHLKHPREYSPMSLMPNFYFLSDSDLQALGVYLYGLGDQTAAEWMILPPVDYLNVKDNFAFPLVKPSTDGTPQGWSSWNASGMQEGKQIYIDRCQTCHGCAGNGLGTYAGTRTVTPANYQDPPIRDMPDDQWIWHVSEGVPGTVMPPWKESLSTDQRWQVIRYIQQEFAHPTERDPDEGDPSGAYANLTNPLPQTVETLDQGKHIFIRECFVCHGDAGKGNGPYGAALRPIPPDFSDKGHYGTIQNPLFTDSDYFWRISEGLPWSAMQIWKERYSEEDRWALVYYIRVNFTQTLPRPKTDQPQEYPAIYLAQDKPQTLSANQVDVGDQPSITYAAPDAELGKEMFTQMCAHCHGFTGVGDGWDGNYLDVKPANFTSSDVKGLSNGDWLARVSYGLQGSAMPSWGEWMPEVVRWNVIEYIQKYITEASLNQPGIMIPSVMGDGSVPANYISTSQSDWTNEVQAPDPKNGETLYNTFCASCHWDKGKGLSADKMVSGLSYPSPLPDNMSVSYTYWRTWDGVPATLMPPFKTILKPADVWDIIGYFEDNGLVTKPGD